MGLCSHCSGSISSINEVSSAGLRKSYNATLVVTCEYVFDIAVRSLAFANMSDLKYFSEKQVLPSYGGCGSGLTGICLCKLVTPAKYTFSDCHKGGKLTFDVQ